MTDKQDCPSLSFRYILHLANSLLLEFRIAHCQHLVHHQNFRLQMGGDSKSQPHGHTRRITFHWSIDIFLHTGESHNLIQLAGNLRLGHPHDGTIHINILPSCHFGMKACTHFQQRGNTPRARMQPAVGEVTRERIFNKVDFPAPFLPIIPSTSPSSTWKLISFNAHTKSPVAFLERSFSSPILRYGSSFPRIRAHQRFKSRLSVPVPMLPNAYCLLIF